MIYLIGTVGLNCDFAKKCSCFERNSLASFFAFFWEKITIDFFRVLHRKTHTEVLSTYQTKPSKKASHTSV